MHRYVGTTNFSRGNKIYGIELEQFWPNAGDGTVEGISYFTSKPGHGYFARSMDLISKEVVVDDEKLQSVKKSPKLEESVVTYDGYEGVVK